MREPRAESGFFGVTSAFMPADPELRKVHYDSLAGLGLRNVRLAMEWDQVEPLDGAPAQRFRWTDPDRRMVTFAKHGISASFAPLHAPSWLPANVEADARFADFMAALARRYGTEGVFWDENRHLDSSLAVRNYEVWTDVNLDSTSWDGSASPAEYARTYSTTRAALRAEDPNARAIVSLVDGGIGGDAAPFLRGMVQSRPSLAGSIDGVYVMAASARTPAELESLVAGVRLALEQSSNPNAKLYVGFGAPTAGPGAMSEAARAQFVAEAARRLPRLDCGVDGAVLHAWTSAQADGANPWDWYGISSISDGLPGETALAYQREIRSFLGFGSQEPPRAALHPCMRDALDRDGDGTPDPVDPDPLDPSVSTPEGQPPSPPAIAGPGAYANSRSASLSISGPGAASFHCRFDGSPWETCTATRHLTNLADGTHTFEARAVDNLGLLSQASRHTWTVDTATPQTTIVSGPSGLIHADNVRFALSSSEAGQFRCRLDSRPWEECGGTVDFSDLEEGTHSFVAAAVDRAGNIDPSEASRFFEVRTIPGNPSISVTGLATQTPTFSFSAAHAASFECRFDGSSFGPCSSARDHTPSRPLVKGSHRFEVRGVGHTGRTGPVAGWTFSTSDTQPPETTIVSGPSGSTQIGPTEFRLESNEDHVAFWCKLDSTPWQPCEATQSYPDLAEGAHVFEAIAVDTAGLADPTPARRDFSLTADHQAPSLALSLPMPSTNRRLRIEFTAEDDTGVEGTECSVGGAPWTACDSPWVTPRLPLGKHKVRVRASDAAGNVTQRQGNVTVRKRRR